MGNVMRNQFGNTKKNINKLSLVCVAALALSLVACTAQEKEEVAYKFDNILKQDRALDYERDDYRRALAPRPLPEENATISGVPDFAPVIAEEQDDILPQPLVSISVNQTIPLRDILFELAEQADVDLELDPGIRGSIIFTARERPFDQVVDRICKLAGLRYTYEDNVLRVEQDEPYIETYHVDYLSMIREFESDVRSSISVLSGDGANSGSNNSIKSANSNDLWAELEINIKQILKNSGKAKGLSQSTRPVRLPDAIPTVTTAQLLENPSGNVAVAGSPGEEVFNEEDALIDETRVDEDGEVENYSFNKQAGLVSVFANQKQHKLIKKYLDAMKASLTTQVLIEAKVLEVGLDDEFSAGINWDTLFSGDFNLGVNFPRVDFEQAAAGTASVGITGSDFNLLAQFVQRFGNVHTLSSPRLTVMNNQSAILNVAENQVFFELDVSREENPDAGTEQTDIDSEIRNVPEGVIISVHPSIDMQSSEITLNLRPSITRVIDTVLEPAAASLGVDNFVPVLAVRELDSIVKMKSGEIIVMGGLMQDQTRGNQTGVPVLSEIPGIGGLFRGQTDRIQKTEMVILLRATIIGDGPKPDSVDKEMFEKFSGDRRPFPL